MSQLITNTAKCTKCPFKTSKDFLVNIRNQANELTFMLCQKTVKQKLLNSGYTLSNVNEAYQRFIVNFSHYKICKQVDDTDKPTVTLRKI